MTTPKPPLTFEEAKALVERGLGEVMQKFPLRFCKPIFFGAPPSRERDTKVNNGTATLLQRNGECVVVTCAHVLTHYRTLRQSDPTCLLTIGNCSLDPLTQLVSDDA